MPFVARKNAVFALLIGAALHLTGAGLFAGDLTPPAGPVGETMKTLQEVEPRTPISQKDVPLQILADGSYYLTESLRPANPGDPFIIRVAVDNVSIDLRGFTIYGSGGGAQVQDGIKLAEGVSNVSIAHGQIVTASDAGIDGAETSVVRVENITSSGHGGDGIRLGAASQTLRCISEGNGGDGFEIGDGGVLESCIARGNFNNGVFASVGSTILNCTADDNFVAGIWAGQGSSIMNSSASFNRDSGIVATAGGAVVGCYARSNTMHGFHGSGASFTACSATGNVKNGFNVASASSLNNCSASSNAIGFVLDEGSVATNCQAKSNGTSGFDASASSTLESCAATLNGGDGFVADRSRIVNCNATSNDLNGFSISASFISQSVAIANDANGILASNQNSIDGNLCKQNGIGLGGYGISLSGSSNAVFRNVCGVNATGQYDAPAAINKVGTITNTPVGAGAWDNLTAP